MEPSDAIEAVAQQDDVFIVRVRPAASANRARVTVKHVASGRVLNSEDFDDIDDFIRMSLYEEKSKLEHS